MKLFKCQYCSQLLHFDNRNCINCSRRLGYFAPNADLLALEPEGSNWNSREGDQVYRFCANAEYDACNWLVSQNDGSRYCLACRHNRTIPDLGLEENLQNWRRVERAKHHLFYSLLRLKLPLETRVDMPDHGLAFDFLAEPVNIAAPVMTGHDNGIITLNLTEADDAVREQRRIAMGEPYRTLLGHFRHEIGHYFWDRLVAGGGALAECREFFGDETADYNAALQSYYRNGPRPAWQKIFVSPYATAHPWEDFAETWAHYLHIMDTLEMASAYGLHIQPSIDPSISVAAADGFDPTTSGTIDQLIDAWLPITLTINSLNGCMGQPEFYPFVLAPAVIAKLGFIQRLVRGTVESTQMLSVAAQ